MQVKKISDYHEKMWFLGTDILPQSDLDLMDIGLKASFVREFGAIYYTHPDFCFEECGYDDYSSTFKSVIKEARKRGYVWVFFDCDIQTQYN